MPDSVDGVAVLQPMEKCPCGSEWFVPTYRIMEVHPGVWTRLKQLFSRMSGDNLTTKVWQCARCGIRITYGGTYGETYGIDLTNFRPR